LIHGVGGNAGDTDETLVDEGLALEIDRLRRRDARRQKQDRRDAGSERFPGASSALIPGRKLT
jgi:hypothetical protein